MNLLCTRKHSLKIECVPYWLSFAVIFAGMYILKSSNIHLGIEFYLFVSHGGMKRQRVHV